MNSVINNFIELNPAIQELERRTGLVRTELESIFQQALTNLPEKLKTQPFWYVSCDTQIGKELPWLLDTTTGIVWVAVSRDEDFSRNYLLDQALNILYSMQAVGTQDWEVPSGDKLWAFAGIPGNPWRDGDHRRLWNKWAWVISSGNRIDLDSNSRPDSNAAYLIGCNTAFTNNLKKLVEHALSNNWCITPVGAYPRNVGTGLNIGISALLTTLKSLYMPKDNILPVLGEKVSNLRNVFKKLDWHSARLPELEDADFTDPKKGLWECWGLDAGELGKLGLRARNPADDIQPGMVAIDFGTSSTVVAYEEHGVGKLLRIGMKNFWDKEKPEHYENPTVLEFIDLKAFLDIWQSQAQRPAVLWDDVRCSHEARHNFRNNQTKPEVVASILTKIKRWALDDDSGQNARHHITDQVKHVEHQLAALTLRNPVKGQPLLVSNQDPFDPIELYAWFLGLTINWRRRGIFLSYYMSFPVDYPREVKEKILASFRRGLQRSLPATLVEQDVFHQQFKVEERASEPAAYAAIALETLNIEPTEEGVPYAVFDFGGGTTDFDFGRYRLPTDAEERSGIEQVFEHFGNGGDKFLGGENLLDHLAYLTFRHNLEVCRSKKIAFSRPPDAEAFSGSEMFLENTQAAVTNTLMLVAKLRTFWETGQQVTSWETGQQVTSSTGVGTIDLIDRDGKKVGCEFIIPWPELAAFLQNRIAVGVKNFFSTLKKAFGNEMPAEIQVLLAGNASRSATVRGLFGLLPEDSELSMLKESTKDFLAELFPNGCPVFTPHAPLETDPANINRPTCKTGVALGLLKLCPGSNTKVVNHAAVQSGGEAPFQHFVGRMRRSKFHPALHQGAAYSTWVELGPLGEDRVFKLFHTQSALALGGGMQAGDPALKLKTLEFAGNSAQQMVLARPTKPHEIEICNAQNVDAANGGELENLQVLRLG